MTLPTDSYLPTDAELTDALLALADDGYAPSTTTWDRRRPSGWAGSYKLLTARGQQVTTHNWHALTLDLIGLTCRPQRNALVPNHPLTDDERLASYESINIQRAVGGLPCRKIWRHVTEWDWRREAYVAVARYSTFQVV